jgi:hypothetical protein
MSPHVPPNEPKVWPPERNLGPTPHGPLVGGCGAAILVLVGVLLLLPGLCGLIVLMQTLSSGNGVGGVAGFVFMTFLIAAIGIALIYAATRSGRS